MWLLILTGGGDADTSTRDVTSRSSRGTAIYHGHIEIENEPDIVSYQLHLYNLCERIRNIEGMMAAV